MKNIHINFIRLCLVVAVGLGMAAAVSAQGGEQRRPELPVGCEHLEAPAEERVAFKVYAEGFQVYSWSGTAWVFVGPLAELYAGPRFGGKVGIHYGGPTWESNSGSLVRAANPVRCTPDADSIPWLLLEAVETDGPGIFNGVTHIQRVNTSGGIAPATPGTTVGEEARIPYTTEYYFYKAQ